MTPAELWRCEECFETHDNEDDARECCPVRVAEGYGCPVCGEFYLDSDAAVECCSDADPDAPFVPQPAELEAAGQQRLFG